MTRDVPVGNTRSDLPDSLEPGAVGCAARRLAFVLAALIVVSPSGAVASPPGPYEVKSGTMELKGDALGESKVLVWFDDYGRREARHTTSTVELFGRKIETVSVSIRTPERTVEYDAGKKKGRVSPGSVPSQMDPRAVSDPKLRERYRVEELPDRVILGRTCKGASIEVLKGWPVRGWTWKGIPMLTQGRLGGGMVTLEVVRLEVDVPVPKDVFDVPLDVTLSK